jgi:hypothetical protein
MSAPWAWEATAASWSGPATVGAVCSRGGRRFEYTMLWSASEGGTVSGIPCYGLQCNGADCDDLEKQAIVRIGREKLRSLPMAGSVMEVRQSERLQSGARATA